MYIYVIQSACTGVSASFTVAFKMLLVLRRWNMMMMVMEIITSITSIVMFGVYDGSQLQALQGNRCNHVLPNAAIALWCH